MEFLTGSGLARKIAKICAGAGPRRCAVAFWGQTAPTLLFPDGIDEAEIVLDVGLKCNTKGALKALGIPKAKNVWAHPGLHSKIYIGEGGAVVTSANASVAALGDKLQGGKQKEAGIWLDAQTDSAAYKAACVEFEALKNQSHLAGKRDVENAPEHSPIHLSWRGDLPDDLSLLALAAASPQDFGNMLFVFGDEKVSRKQRQAADQAFKAQNESLKAASNEIIENKSHELMVYCARGEERNFEAAALVVMFWAERGKLELLAYSQLIKVPVFCGGEKAFAFYAVDSWKELKRIAKLPLKYTRSKILVADEKLANRIMGPGKQGGRWKECLAQDLPNAIQL